MDGGDEVDSVGVELGFGVGHLGLVLLDWYGKKGLKQVLVG